MLTEALEELLLDENLRREIGTKARMRVQEYYAIDNYVNQLVSYYEKLRKRLMPHGKKGKCDRSGLPDVGVAGALCAEHHGSDL